MALNYPIVFRIFNLKHNGGFFWYNVNKRRAWVTWWLSGWASVSTSKGPGIGYHNLAKGFVPERHSSSGCDYHRSCTLGPAFSTNWLRGLAASQRVLMWTSTSAKDLILYFHEIIINYNECTEKDKPGTETLTGPLK